MDARSAQAYLESLLAVLVLVFLIFGALQVALLFGESAVMHHAAARAARAKAVGFNDWMALKAARVASIPVSGRLSGDSLDFAKASGGEAAFEKARIPEYLAAENHARASYILDYEEWNGGRLSLSESGGRSGAIVGFSARHDVPLKLPLGFLVAPGAVADEDGIPRLAVESGGVAADHSPHYLEAAW